VATSESRSLHRADVAPCGALHCLLLSAELGAPWAATRGAEQSRSTTWLVTMEAAFQSLLSLVRRPRSGQSGRIITDEERVHAGEFLKLLHYLAPEEAKLYEKGANEVDGILSEVQRK